MQYSTSRMTRTCAALVIALEVILTSAPTFALADNDTQARDQSASPVEVVSESSPAESPTEAPTAEPAAPVTPATPVDEVTPETPEEPAVEATEAQAPEPNGEVLEGPIAEESETAAPELTPSTEEIVTPEVTEEAPTPEVVEEPSSTTEPETIPTEEELIETESTETASSTDPVATEETDTDLTSDPSDETASASSTDPLIETEESDTASSTDPIAETIEDVATPEVEEPTLVTGPTLTTDLPDYHPGDTAIITGAFFVPHFGLVLRIVGGTIADGNYIETTLPVSTDENGSFKVTYALDNIYRPVYLVTAETPEGTHIASITFTDSVITSTLPCVPNPSITGSVIGGMATLNVPRLSCPAQVSFTSYAHTPGSLEPFESQTLVDNITATYGPGVHEIGPLKLDCNWQTDLYLGPLQYPRAAGSGNAGLIAYDYILTGNCTPPPPPPTAPCTITSSVEFEQLRQQGKVSDSFLREGNSVWANLTNNSDCTVSWYIQVWKIDDRNPPPYGTQSFFGQTAVVTSTPHSGIMHSGYTPSPGCDYQVDIWLAGVSTWDQGGLDGKIVLDGICPPPLRTPDVVTIIHDATHAGILTAPAGSTVHDSAAVSGSAGTPTGTVDFTFYTNGNCTGQGTPSGTGIALVAGVAHPSQSQGPLNAGSYSFKAHYNGDTNYNPSDATCEPLTVNGGTPEIATTPNPASGIVGITLHDSATLTGGINPTGTITFKLFGPDDPVCEGFPKLTNVVNVNGNGSYNTSAGFASNAVGVWRWMASYSGDVHNASAHSGCSDEQVTVTKARPEIVTAIHKGADHQTSVTSVPAGSTVHDSATVSGGNSPTGSVTFKWFTNGTCYGTPADTSSAFPLSGGSVDATTFAKGPLAAGSYSFQGQYNGDANNESATSACEPLTVSQKTPIVVTEIHNAEAHTPVTSVPAGSTVHDKAIVTGSFGTPTGTVAFSWFTNGTCYGAHADTSAALALSGGSVDAVGFAKGPLAAGLYSFRAHYSGDVNYVSADGPCEPLEVTKIASYVTTEVHTANHTDITNSNVVVGTTVHDKAIVTGSAGTPTGTVDFKRYATIDCTGASIDQDNVALAGGTAESSVFATIAGVLSYKVHYDGDATYNESTGICEPLTVDKYSPTITTLLSTMSTTIGSSVHDSATLSNASSDAGGTVTYTVYSNSSCTQNPISAGVKNVTNGVVPDSDAVVFNTAGTFYWQAEYSGDAKNNPATSGCLEEILTVTQQKGRIIVDKVTDPSGAETSFHFNTTGAGYNAFDLTDEAAPNDQELVAGTYSVSEVLPTGWDLTSAKCSVNQDAETTYAPGSNLVLGGSDVIRCTFKNTKRGRIIVDKVTVPGGSSAVFEFTTTGEGYTDFSLSDQANPNNQELEPGTYTVSETSLPGWLSDGGYCDNDQSPEHIMLQPGEIVHCTFTNTKQKAKLIVQKTTYPYGDPTVFTIMASGTGTITGGGAGTITDATDKTYEVTPGTYSVAETVPAGWDKTGDTCQNVIIQAGETVTCHVINTRRGRIIVDKVTHPYGDPQSFVFVTTGDDYEGFSLTDMASPNSQSLKPGTYSVSENDIQGWSSDGGVCDHGETPADIALGAGETIHCTFTNTKMAKGTIIVKKVMVGGTSSFGFTGSPSGTIGANNGTLSMQVNAGQYVSTENAKAGWDLVSVVCNDGNSVGSVLARTATFNVSAGETVRCTFTNKKKGHVIVDKVTYPYGDPTSFAITATGSGSITGGGAGSVTDETNKDYEVTHGTYSVTETVPAGWEQISNTCHNVSVAAGETKTCIIKNKKKTPPTGKIKGMKFKDEDGDGKKDYGESGLANWVIALHGGSGTTTTTTDHDGNYSFSNLPQGTYLVCEIQQQGWEQTFPRGNGGCWRVDVAGGSTVTGKDFGNAKAASCPDHAYSNLYDRSGRRCDYGNTRNRYRAYTNTAMGLYDARSMGFVGTTATMRSEVQHLTRTIHMW